MVRRMFVIALVAALAACTGDSTGSLRAPSGSPSARAKRTRVTSEPPPPAQMHVGTDVVHGVLTRYCEGSKCDADSSPRAPLELTATEQGLLLFVLKRAPSAARVEIERRTGALALRRDLHAGTPTLAVHEELRPGRYVV